MKTSTNPNATDPEVGFICCQVSKPLGLPAGHLALLSFNSYENVCFFGNVENPLRFWAGEDPVSVSAHEGLTHKCFGEWEECWLPILPNPQLSWHLAAPKALGKYQPWHPAWGKPCSAGKVWKGQR